MHPRNSRRRPASAQELLPLDEIEGDVVRLRGGDYRAVLRAGSVNFALKAEAEQEAIVAGYRRFLNALTYPLQVLVRVVPTDVEAYLDGLAGPTENEALASLARDHRTFVRRIARERTLLDRRFYVIVPAGADTGAERRGTPLPWRRRSARHAQSDLVAARRRLAFRCNEVAQALVAFGVSTERLDANALITLWRDALGAASVPTHVERPSAGAVVLSPRRALEAGRA